MPEKSFRPGRPTDGANGSPAFQKLDLQVVPNLRPEDLRQFGGHDQSFGRQFNLMIGLIDDSAVQGMGGESLDSQLPALPSEANADEGVPGGFDGSHARQLGQEVLNSDIVGLDQPQGKVLALYHVPLKVHDFGHAIPEGVGHDEDAGGQRQARYREDGLNRLALQVADRDAESVGEEMPDAGALDQGGAVTGRGLGAHGFRGREAGGAAHRAEYAGRGRGGADHQGQGKGGVLGPEAIDPGNERTDDTC